MSLFGMLSKKPASPRPNILEEKEDGLLYEGEASHRKRTKSKSKKQPSSSSFLSPDPVEESPSDDEEVGGAVSRRETEAEEETEVEEHVEEDKKPFDATTSLLVFHNGQIYVREDRPVLVQQGRATIHDLPWSIRPSSLHFRSFSDPDASIIEHTFENGVESWNSLLAESVGEAVTLGLNGTDKSVVTGKLLHTTAEKEDVVVETQDGAVVTVSRSSIASVEVRHAHFNKEPTLHCLVETSQEGPHKAQLTYEAAGINWSTEYSLVVRPDSTAEFTGWITLGNYSGKFFKDAALALVGELHSTPASYDRSDITSGKSKKAFVGMGSFFKSKSVKPQVSTQDTTHMPRPITLEPGKDKQVRVTHATFPVEQINLFRKFVGRYKGSFQGAHPNSSTEGSKSVEKVLRWINSASTHPRLGVELPEGTIDVLDSVKGDTFLSLRHQTELPFTRPNDEIALVTGHHSDFSGERRVTELKVDARTRTIRESVQIELRNTGPHKQVVVVEDLLWRWHQYVVSPCQPKYEGAVAQVLAWRIAVPARTTETIRYTVLYSDVPQL